jgi:hypothetical protein
MQFVMICRLAFLLHSRIIRISGNQVTRNQMVFILVVILPGLNSKERQTQDQCRNQTENLGALLTDLCEIHSHRHRETAEDQDDSVERSQREIEVVTRGRKSGRKLRTVERVSQEHAAEEHDLGHEKHPHSQRARLTLLLHVLEMVLQRAMVVRFRCCCVTVYYIRHVLSLKPALILV